MEKWRKTKQKIKKSLNSKETKDFIVCASISLRIKAFIVDMFMIMMPLAYFITYMIMDGKDDFQGSQQARWSIAIIYGFIIIVFWISKGQTPGFKAYSLKLIDSKTKQKISLFKAILRYMSFLIACTTIVLTLIPFFRDDKRTFQDLISSSLVVDYDYKEI